MGAPGMTLALQVHVKDRQGRYLWVNRAFRVQHSLDHPSGHEGASVEHILGKTDYELSPVFLADQYRLDDEQVLAGHRIVNRLERVGESRGTTAWNVTDKIPVVGAGAIIGTAEMTRTAGPASSVGQPTPAWRRAGPHARPFPARDANRRLAACRTCRFAPSSGGSVPPSISPALRKLACALPVALVYTDDSLSDIALRSGFADQSHFSREFRRQFGRTPRAYREHYRSAPAPRQRRSCHRRCRFRQYRPARRVVISPGGTMRSRLGVGSDDRRRGGRGCSGHSGRGSGASCRRARAAAPSTYSKDVAPISEELPGLPPAVKRAVHY
jgi:hypothetical protein